jgi:hypothetical protein
MWNPFMPTVTELTSILNIRNRKWQHLDRIFAVMDREQHIMDFLFFFFWIKRRSETAA